MLSIQLFLFLSFFYCFPVLPIVYLNRCVLFLVDLELFLGGTVAVVAVAVVAVAVAAVAVAVVAVAVVAVAVVAVTVVDVDVAVAVVAVAVVAVAVVVVAVVVAVDAVAVAVAVAVDAVVHLSKTPTKCHRLYYTTNQQLDFPEMTSSRH